MPNLTLTDALARQAEPDGLLDYNPLIDDTDYEGERLAEGAWLRYAENLGWEEAYYESLIESGLRSRLF